MDDVELIARLNSGDPTAFAALYYRYRDWVYRVAWRHTQHHEDALDVVQDCFAYFANKFPGFALRARLTTFLYPVAKHLALKARARRAKVAGEVIDIDSIPALPTGEPDQEDGAALGRALARLPAPQREVVELRFVDELKLEEIALVLEVPLGTIKSRLHHALKALAEVPELSALFREV
ncbi:MAG: RNA polymerase sigma factor [Planctomycetota bacterium]